MKKLNHRLLIFLAVTIIGTLLAIPSLLPGHFWAKVKLGLDLQGGLHMTLGVKTDEAVEARTKSIALSIKYFAEKNDILIDKLKGSGHTLSFELLDGAGATKIDELLATEHGISIQKNGMQYGITLTKEEIAATKTLAVTQAVETIRNRLDLFGLSEPSITKSGEDNVIVELPGIKSQAEEQRARELIAKTAKLELMSVDPSKAMNLDKITADEAMAEGIKILEDYKNKTAKYAVKEMPILDGSMLTDAKVGYDQNGQPVINFTLNSQGAGIFGDFTGKNVGTHLAIVLDGKVYSAPVIRERIGGGSGQISGSFTPDEARDLAIALRSGALPASVVMLEKRSVGPSLGADSINQSMIAFASGAILVFGFIIVYYGRAGIFANIALVSNIVLIIAIMALFNATLTLPGMAALVLTIGMSVDANVIINERIRELLRHGVTTRKAIEQGYENAMSAIVDSNVTAIIAAVAMYIYGTGPIKGFAIVMTIGILVSMLTAIVGTHGLFEHFLPRIERDKNLKKWFGLDETLFEKKAA